MARTLTITNTRHPIVFRIAKSAKRTGFGIRASHGVAKSDPDGYSAIRHH